MSYRAIFTLSFRFTCLAKTNGSIEEPPRRPVEFPSKQTGKEGSAWRPDGDTSSGPQGGILHDSGSHSVQAGENRRKLKVLITPLKHLSCHSFQMCAFDQSSLGLQLLL